MTVDPANDNFAARQLEADRLLAEGTNQYNNSNFEAALNVYQKARDIYQEIGDQNGVMQAINNIGLVQYGLGNYKQAIELLEQALEISRSFFDKTNQADTLDNIGWIYKNIGQKYHDEALAIRNENPLENPGSQTSDPPIIQQPRRP